MNIDVMMVLIKDHKVYFCMQGHILVYDYHKIKHIRVKRDLTTGIAFWSIIPYILELTRRIDADIRR